MFTIGRRSFSRFSIDMREPRRRSFRWNSHVFNISRLVSALSAPKSEEAAGEAPEASVGYTNAGKSSLMRALTSSDVLVADQFFATLDTTVPGAAAGDPTSHPRLRHRWFYSKPSA